ncbi:MAG: hypothetical protein OEW52_00280 [Thermoleophilia bacterium]|nr:hypothetical protein [Thermoleophilia bacterium]
MSSEAYRDHAGRTTPPSSWGPGLAYLGNLGRGRVCTDHRGARLKVLAQNVGSTTVRRSGSAARTFTRADGSVAQLGPTSEEITLARGTVVRVRTSTVSCAVCAAHYGDAEPCDEGKPVNSPHRATVSLGAA